jgi:acyl-CoA dehydrogenase
MTFDVLFSPVEFLCRRLPLGPLAAELRGYENWWEIEGIAISETIDRGGTPWLRMFDRFGQRTDEILFPPEYRTLLLRGYREGHVWRAFENGALHEAYLFGYLTAFYDSGLYCPYTVSLATAVSLWKYGTDRLKARFLPPLLRRDDEVWQGATWMTEIGGGSDLGTTVETVARPAGEGWLLTGEKFFASNAGAELAVVAARPEGAPAGIRGLALFLVPKFGDEGALNYTVRRLKDKVGTRSVPTGEVELRKSEGWLLGRPEWGIYQILEALNLSRAANAVASVALAQRALREAFFFAQKRVAFGRPILEHPLIRSQFLERYAGLQTAFALGWEAVTLQNEVWQETPPYTPRYHLFRLVAHLAKYHTAEFAAQTAKWAMEVHGGLGVLGEVPVERWFREAMVLAIWEGTSHRQILDGLEVIQRKEGHRLLFEHLAPLAPPQALAQIQTEVERHLALPPEEQEAQGEKLFAELARFTGDALKGRLLEEGNGK